MTLPAITNMVVRVHKQLVLILKGEGKYFEIFILNVNLAECTAVKQCRGKILRFGGKIRKDRRSDN